ncbi:hypothetical protein ALO60_00255 [Pseudomonas amygdali pv. tabaci]|nr:hypothetical protein ALO60_00255 [Pseudomonas amygdali pv. tabaci]
MSRKPLLRLSATTGTPRTLKGWPYSTRSCWALVKRSRPKLAARHTSCAASRLSWWRMFRVLYPLTTALLLLGTQLHRTPSAYRRPGCRSASLQASLRAGLGQ